LSRGLRAVLLIAVVASASAARADEHRRSEREIEELMDRAARALEAEDYDTALAAFREAHDRTGRPVLLYNIGMCYQAMRDQPNALQAFREYLEAGRGTEPAERIAEVEGLIRELEPPAEEPRAMLAVETNQPGARIFVDGEVAGQAPLAEPLQVRAGAYIVEARLEGFLTARQQVVLTAGQTTTISLELRPQEDAEPGAARTWFWVSFGLTGAAGAALAVTGGLMLADRQEYLDGGRHDADLYDTTLNLAIASDVLLGVTLAAAVATSILLWVAWSGADGETDETGAVVGLAPGGLVLTW
jgi:tetratricopeptide (TPR) repeat protein